MVRGSEPLVIVGSRLQAIAVAAVAVAATIGLVGDQPLVLVPAAAAMLFAASRLLLRVELHDDRVEVRRWLATNSASRADTEAELGHRYLGLALPDVRRLRIEVPVEIRPQVRRWADATATNGPLGDDANSNPGELSS